MTIDTELPTLAAEHITKTWLATLDGLSKLQEQNEKLLIEMLQYNREVREESKKVAEKVFAQIAESQKNVTTLVETATRTMTAAFKIPGAPTRKN